MTLVETVKKLSEQVVNLEGRMKQQEGHTAQVLDALTKAANHMKQRQEAQRAGASQYIFIFLLQNILNCLIKFST